MPTNKNAFTRYKILDELLSDRFHQYSIDDLTDKVNEKLDDMEIEPVTTRCIQKDLDYMGGYQSPFCAIIDATPFECVKDWKVSHRKYYRYSDPTFSIFKKEMTDEEEQLLSQTLSILGQFDGMPNLGELERLRKGKPTKAMRQVVSFDKNPLENSTLFGEIFTAITQKQVIKLNYYIFVSKDEVRSILFHPYMLKEYNRRWYVFGIADYDKKELHFALDRIGSIEPQPAMKYIEYDGQYDEWFDDIVGVTRYEDKPVEKILFWVSDRSMDYVATKPIHDSQKQYSPDTKFRNDAEYRALYPNLSDGAFFSIECIENYELIRELTSFGENLIVLQPESLKSKIIERISAMNEKYSGI